MLLILQGDERALGEAVAAQASWRVAVEAGAGDGSRLVGYWLQEVSSRGGGARVLTFVSSFTFFVSRRLISCDFFSHAKKRATP